MSDLFGNPDYFTASQDLFQGIGTLFGGLSEGAASGASAGYYKRAATQAQVGGEIKSMMLRRQAYQVLGGAQADIASSGLKLSGSALGVMRSNAQQAAMAQGVNRLNTQMQVAGYEAQAKAADQASSSSLLGGIVGGVAKVASAAIAAGI